MDAKTRDRESGWAGGESRGGTIVVGGDSRPTINEGIAEIADGVGEIKGTGIGGISVASVEVVKGEEK